MESRNQEEIREAVRERYGKIAKNGSAASLISKMKSCCRPSEIIAETGKTGSCCSSGDLSADNISAILGYSKDEINSVPEGANMGLGCGNPVALASLKPGETVVDLGSGGGFDCFLASKEVGEEGRVIGVDMTAEMVSKARKNAENAGTGNVEFRLGEIEHLPVADNSADIIMSNCVINLSPDKSSVYQDAYRVLKPGGRLSISDIVTTARLPVEVKRDLELISACIGGAVTIEDTQKMLQQAGFENIFITPKKISQEMIDEMLPGSPAGEYVVSASIEARKPVSST